MITADDDDFMNSDAGIGNGRRTEKHIYTYIYHFKSLKPFLIIEGGFCVLNTLLIISASPKCLETVDIKGSL